MLGELVVSELASVSLDPGRLIAEAVARDGMRKVIAGEIKDLKEDLIN